MSSKWVFTLALVACLPLSIGWIALAQSNRTAVHDEALRDLARVIAASELQNTHWTKVAGASSDFMTAHDVISEDLTSDLYSWKTRFVWAGMGDALGLDKMDRQAVSEIERGKNELYQNLDDNAIHFARSIRVKSACVSCHPLNPESRKPFGVDEIMGTSIVRIYQRDVRREREAEIELATAIKNLREVARKYSDTKAVEPVLEVLRQLP